MLVTEGFRRGRFSIAVILAMLVGTLPSAPAAAHARIADGTAAVVVRTQPGAAEAVAARVRASGGHLTRWLPLINGFAADVPTAALPALGADRQVRALTADSPVHLLGDTTTSSSDGPTSPYVQSLRADKVWQAGDQGQGVTVAVIDTGVAPVTDLAGRVVPVVDDRTGKRTPCENLSGEPDCTDNYGHGTFVAGIIAGNGAASAGEWTGVAPQANVLSVKVAGRDGATDVSNVLAAIQWVVSFKDRYNIRVLNLSLATDSTQSYLTDPFDYAVERAWDAGVVVVVSAGNRGPGPATISKPGDDPLVITVGAVDDGGTPGVGDDALPAFTSRGPTAADGLAKPDVAAPGTHIVSLRSVGSTIDTAYPDYVDGAYHRGSGTSFSAAGVSGVVALMLSRWPALTPNQVKYALRATARTLPGIADTLAVGAGEVDAAAAALTPPAGQANLGVIRSNGTGLLSGSRGHVQVQTVDAQQTVVDGELTAQLIAWDPCGYALGWNVSSWYLSTWYVTPMFAVTWSASDWPGHNWGGHNWGGGTWEGATWDGTYTDRDYGNPIEGSIWFGAWG